MSKSLEKIVLRNKKVLIYGFQIFVVVFSFYFAFLLRFEFDVPEEQASLFLKTVPLLLITRLITYHIFKLNSGWWQFVSMPDLINIIKATFLGSNLFILSLILGNLTAGFPRSVLILEPLLNVAFLGGIRFLARWFRESRSNFIPKQLENVLLIGAGKAGTLLLNEIRSNRHLGIRVVGFIDNDPLKQNDYINGVQVLGTCKNLPEIVKKYEVDEAIICIPSAGYKIIAEIVRMVQTCGIDAKVLPGLGDLIQRNGFWNQLQNISYDDLLDRPILKFQRKKDVQLLEKEIRDNVVMVTGAGGSIGSELCRQIAPYQPKYMLLFECSENNLFQIEMECRENFPDMKIIPVLGDIRDEQKVRNCFENHAIDVIYHAAAFKHVPMMERETYEAVRNNILGTRLLAETAMEFQVRKFVAISTDKAVNPVNVMGTTKRVAEMLLQCYSNDITKFITVRFGNVIGSNGSALPLFRKQISRGGPITITHPDVTRYFMAISEAVQLVIIAGAMGSGGEIYLLDMGKPVKILDLAKKLIESAGLIPEKDIEIKFTGLRPGEKLYEQLHEDDEKMAPTANEKIIQVKPVDFDQKDFFQKLELLHSFGNKFDNREVIRILKSLCPQSHIEIKTPRSRRVRASSKKNEPEISTVSAKTNES